MQVQRINLTKSINKYNLMQVLTNINVNTPPYVTTDQIKQILESNFIYDLDKQDYYIKHLTQYLKGNRQTIFDNLLRY